MRRHLCLMALCCLAGTLQGLAQTTDDAETRARIREIKLSEQYVYAQGMSDKGFDEARTVAIEGLRIEVATELATQRLPKDEVEAAMEHVEQHCQLWQYRQMGFYKAFACLPKGRLATLADPAPTVPADTVPATPLQPAVPAAPQVDVAFLPDEAEAELSFTLDDLSASALAANRSARPTDSPAPETDRPAQEPEPSVAQPVAEPVQEPEPSAVQPETPVVQPEAEPAPLPDPQLADALTDSLPGPRQRVIGDLLALDTYEGVMLYLRAMKEDGRLMYGRLSTLVKPDEAYLIVVKDGRLLTVLDQGHGAQRTNLRTRQTDDIRRYKGHAVIWLKVFLKKEGGVAL